MSLTQSQLLSDAQCASALGIASDVARRLLIDCETAVFPRVLADGSAGMLLLLGAMERAGIPTPDSERQKISHLMRALNGRSNDLSLFTGWAGIYAAARFAFADNCIPISLQPIRQALKHAVDSNVRSPFSKPASYYEVDLISGLAGMSIADATSSRSALLFLGWLSEDAALRLRLPNREGPESVDLGMAHGISGLLVSLAFEGRDTSAIRLLSTFVLENATDSQGEILDFRRTKETDLAGMRSASWCYGGMGISAGLLAAALTLDDDLLTASARNAALTVTTEDPETGRWFENDLSLCHGTAGNALILATIGTHSRDSRLIERARRATDLLIDSFDPTLKFGYRTLNSNGELDDERGFLTGALGVSMSLMALACPTSSGWLRLLGIPPLEQVPPDSQTLDE